LKQRARPSISWIDKARLNAAAAAIHEIHNNTIIGLGSGNTVLKTLELAANRIKTENFHIAFVPTSYQVEIAAQKLGLETTTLDENKELDLAIDGADQAQWRSLDLVKGGGAALLREKIVDSTTKKLVIVVDEKKLAKTLGGEDHPIPVEIVSFGYQSILAKIRRISEKALLREATTGKVGPVVTDNGNFIADVYFKSLKRPDVVEDKLRQIPGVVETGLFLGMCDMAYVGRRDGKVDILHRN
jgi:ribose 5-phosphate isomerase A